MSFIKGLKAFLIVLVMGESVVGWIEWLCGHSCGAFEGENQRERERERENQGRGRTRLQSILFPSQ